MTEHDDLPPTGGVVAPTATPSRTARLAVWLALVLFAVALAVAACGVAVSG